MKVPFGKSVTHAFVVRGAVANDVVPEGTAIKDVLDWDTERLRIPPDVFALCQFAHEYYLSPLGEVLAAAAPPAAFSVSAKESPPRPRMVKERSYSPVSHILNAEQRLAADGIWSHSGEPSVSLLEGVTGSGKTEVYLELARRTLEEGRGVLVLVPEIALTSQLVDRFRNGLGGVAVGLWHSALSDGARCKLIEDLRSGAVRVVVGARSAVFAPVRELGLIVVDEEHDPTFKQEDRVRYHARDLSVVRARITGSRLVLGSATPSLESRERAREGKYASFKLTSRFGVARMPAIHILQLGEAPRVEGIQAELAVETLEEIKKTLAAGEQVMVYLNRRGFAAFLLCEDCGEVAECPNCSISLTVHRRDRALRCHVCAHEERIFDICQKCHSDKLKPMGAGTESLEEELPALLPEARILRLDRDRVTSQSRLEKALDAFRSGEFNLLLGTQMLVKGHDFPGVTLVVVVLADALFRWPDFRAPERAVQTLLQVAGRAGRGEKPGRVWIQTYDPDHPVLSVLRGETTMDMFVSSERELREALSYPPFGRLARIRFEALSSEEARSLAREAAQELSTLAEVRSGALEVLGPSEAFLEKAKNSYRWDLLLKAKQVQAIQRAARRVRAVAAQKKGRTWIDIDPYGL